MSSRQRFESQPLGLDEIMIVNPGSMPVRLNPIATLGAAHHAGARPSLFLGDDGIVYALRGADDPVRSGDLLMGYDGAFHRVADHGLKDDLSDLELD